MINLKEFEKYEDEVIEHYKQLHKEPELGFEEHKTSAYIMEKLTEYGVECKQVAITGVIGTIYGAEEGKTIAIRADMDALPLTEMADVEYKSTIDGVMHACGHDAHVSMLLGAAKYLNDNKDKIKGNIRLIFQPAEEGMDFTKVSEYIEKGCDPNGGAASMIAAGALENVDACFALHVTPQLPLGILSVNRQRAMASSDIFDLTILGKGGHGSSPESAIDPTGALADIISVYNSMPAREFSPFDTFVVSIGTINTDSSWNIIPDRVRVTGGVRAFDNNLRDNVFKRLQEIAEDICKAHKCKAVFKRTRGYDPTINHPEISEVMAEVANEVLGEGKGIIVDQPLMGSEDVGYYFQKVKGAIGFLGTAADEKEVLAPHHPKFKVNTDSLKYGVAFHVNMAMKYLNNN